MLSRSVVFACALMLAVRAQDASEDVCSESGSITDKTRFAAIREDLLAKLHFSSLPISDVETSDDDSVDPALLQAYEAAVRAHQARARETESCGGGRGRPSFAKRISLFFPAEVSQVYPSPDMLEKEVDHSSKDDTHVNREGKKAHKQNSLDGSAELAVPPVEYTFKFELSLPSRSQIFSAELRLYKKKTSKLDSKQMFENIQVYYVSRKEGIEVGKILVTSKNVDNNVDQQESLDVTEAVKKWVSDGATAEKLELRIVINCPLSTASGLFYPPTVEFVTEEISEEKDQPNYNVTQLVIATILEEVAVELDNRKHKRQPMSSQYCIDNPNRIHCCIHDLEVDFHRDLNLTWILFPRTFYPNYCQGLCPYPFSPNDEILRTVRDYIHQNDIGEGPCCGIYSMRSVILLIQDPVTGSVELRDVPDMEVDSCVCM